MFVLTANADDLTRKNLGDTEAFVTKLVESNDTTRFLKKYKGKDNWFIGANIGGSLSMSENTRFGNFFKISRPAMSLIVGKKFHPAFGVRFNLGYRPQVGRADWELSKYYSETFGNYDFKVAGGYVDGIVDLFNIFNRYKEDRRWELNAILGLGFNYTFGFDKEAAARMDKGCPNPENGTQFTYHIDTRNKGYFAGQFGLQGVYHIADAWDINAEVMLNGTDDAYNGVTYTGLGQDNVKNDGKPYDLYLDVLVGFAYHFKDQYGAHRFAYRDREEERLINEYANRLREEARRLQEERNTIINKVEEVRYDTVMQTTINFYIDRYYITEEQKVIVRSVANFLELHPDINLVVTGYADIQTANPEYNLRLSKRRATAVYNMLVTECGVDPSRLKIDYLGDTAQPFEIVNEWNRAVLFRMVRRDQ